MSEVDENESSRFTQDRNERNQEILNLSIKGI